MKSVHEVPVTGLSSHRVGGKESHSENFGLGVVLRGKSATNNVIVVNLDKHEQFRHKQRTNARLDQAKSYRHINDVICERHQLFY